MSFVLQLFRRNAWFLPLALVACDPDAEGTSGGTDATTVGVGGGTTVSTGPAGGGGAGTGAGGQGGEGGEGGAPPLPEEWFLRFTEVGLAAADVVEVAARSDGSTVVIGTFASDGTGQIDFGTGPILPEQTDVFVLALDPFGQTQWVLTLGHEGDEMLYPRVRTNDLGEVYLAFIASGPVSFGDGPIPVVDDGDVILAKLDAGGNYLWSSRLGSIGAFDSLTAFDVSPDGHVAIGVFYQTSWMLQGVPIQAVGANGVASSAVFVFDTDGDFQSHRVMEFHPSGGGPTIHACTVEDDGSTTVAGPYGASVADPPLPPLAQDVGQRGYVARFAPDGSTQWSMSFGDSGMVYLGFLEKTTLGGGHWIAGYLGQTGSIDFGEGPVSQGGAQDVYLARIDQTGQFVMGTVFPAIQGGAGFTSLSSTSADGVLLAGVLGDSVDFGGGFLLGQGGGVRTGFGAAFDAAGDHLWSAALETNTESWLRSLVESPQGDLRFGGIFTDEITFDNTDITQNGMWGDGFVGRWAAYPPF
ncbi:MAG: hypothetical protein HOV80_00850 [Polyangiaceae bacterium]|nr:hypothetical protein [Polyangiaceae bacterium]